MSLWVFFPWGDLIKEKVLLCPLPPIFGLQNNSKQKQTVIVEFELTLKDFITYWVIDISLLVQKDSNWFCSSVGRLRSQPSYFICKHRVQNKTCIFCILILFTDLFFFNVTDKIKNCLFFFDNNLVLRVRYTAARFFNAFKSSNTF